MSERERFEHPDLKLFLLSQNRRAETWINANWERLKLWGELDPSTISKTLNGKVVAAPVVRAFEELYRAVQDDPWAWAHPGDLDTLQDVAGMGWWHGTLDLSGVINFHSWQMTSRRGMSDDVRAAVQERFDAWSSRLRVTCDTFQQHVALVRAFSADLAARDKPDLQEWVRRDGAVHRAALYQSGEHVAWKRKPPYGLHQLFYRASIKTTEHFVEQAAIARALSMIDMPLPDVERAALRYDVRVTDDDRAWAENEVERMLQTSFIESVPRAWNGESWEFITTYRDDRQLLCRYVWDDEAWDYRDEVVDEWHKVWQGRTFTGTVIEAHFDEPPEDNREWVPERDVIVSEREHVGGQWRDVKRTIPGFWAYPGETTRRKVGRQEVGGEWVEGHWRDLTPEERERKATGLARLTMPTVEAVKADWLASAREADTEDMNQPGITMVIDDEGKKTIKQKRLRTEAELEARWAAVCEDVMVIRAREVAERDAAIAERLAALSNSPPD